jgi:hypothetical protein
VNLLAILVSAVAAFVISGGYYGLLGHRLASLSAAYAGEGRSTGATVVVEVVRNLVLAASVAGLARGLGLDGPGPALLFALVLWVAFPVILLTGSVFHERVPPLLATIHAGDWLLKLAVIAVVVTLWV